MSEPTKPEALPEWASDSIKDGISGQYNVYEPPAQKRKLGWNYREKPARQWLNWLHNLTYRWLLYFDYFLNRPKTYTNAAKPLASAENEGVIIFISDVGGASGTLARSDGTNWKKINVGGDV
jgi:hypothetical protein